jgi:hypothetical protein
LFYADKQERTDMTKLRVASDGVSKTPLITLHDVLDYVTTGSVELYLLSSIILGAESLN